MEFRKPGALGAPRQARPTRRWLASGRARATVLVARSGVSRVCACGRGEPGRSRARPRAYTSLGDFFARKLRRGVRDDRSGADAVDRRRAMACSPRAAPPTTARCPGQGQAPISSTSCSSTTTLAQAAARRRVRDDLPVAARLPPRPHAGRRRVVALRLRAGRAVAGESAGRRAPRAAAVAQRARRDQLDAGRAGLVAVVMVGAAGVGNIGAQRNARA